MTLLLPVISPLSAVRCPPAGIDLLIHGTCKLLRSTLGRQIISPRPYEIEQRNTAHTALNRHEKIGNKFQK